jgi:hypothetical protein
MAFPAHHQADPAARGRLTHPSKIILFTDSAQQSPLKFANYG